ncbi:MAG: RnfABCDGE type electron transport complex subunit D [Kiritimatiellae bacterium]|nr:RnfABCDGE type electron transport complex subunit D [Kiritimatiellia bacterium]
MNTTGSVSPAPTAGLTVAPGPHLADRSLTTQRMMVDVLLGLLPLVAVALAQFRHHALFQIAVTVSASVIAEWLFARMRSRPATLWDASAVVTGLILALSLPATAPWYAGAVGAVVAIGIGKAIFGGLGQNLFNPAMVGRAFAMIAFPAALGASAYVSPAVQLDAVSGATPLTALKMSGTVTPVLPLFLGLTNGSIGETSALAALLGGAYLCARRTASWEIPAGAIIALLAATGLPVLWRGLAAWTPLHELCAGAFLYGAFFIATDPVTTPLTPRGKWIFGIGFGLLVVLIRRLSGYPEGVMFAILIMNALVPLINRATIPVPVGGPTPGTRT